MSPFERLLAPAETTTVVVSRHWNRPEIRVTLNEGRIELVASISDFMQAVVAEMGSPALLLTRSQLERAVARATIAALEKVKQASTAAVVGGAP